MKKIILCALLVLTSAVLTYIDYCQDLTELEQRTRNYADFVATHGSVALAFSSDEDLKFMLESLCERGLVVAAGLARDDKGPQLLAFSETKIDVAERMRWMDMDSKPTEGARGHLLLVTAPMEFFDELHGTLYLVADSTEIRSGAITKFSVLLCLGGACFLTGFLGFFGTFPVGGSQ